MHNRKLHKHVDMAGIGISFLCAVHCALLPLLVTALPLLGLQVFTQPSVELLMIVLSIIVGATSLALSFHKHKNLRPLTMLIIGFLGITAGHYWVAETLESFFTACGGLTIAISHYLNWQMVNRVDACRMP